jgi:hypothetical protein
MVCSAGSSGGGYGEGRISESNSSLFIILTSTVNICRDICLRRTRECGIVQRTTSIVYHMFFKLLNSKSKKYAIY